MLQPHGGRVWWRAFIYADSHDAARAAQAYETFAPLNGQFHDNVTVTYPEELLLFFHHLPWEYELDDGTTIVQRLYDNCFAGVEHVREFRDRWRSLKGEIDDLRYRHVAMHFEEQIAQAERWRDYAHLLVL